LGMTVSKFLCDIVITVGGDGTLILTSQRAKVPILPVRIEGKGFLCTCNFDELEKNVKRIFTGNYTIIERMRLRCTKVPVGKIEKYVGKLHKKEYPFCINEIAFARKRPSKLLNIQLKIDDVVFDMIGDGVMFSTPSGSTAYSASAGGSIIDPKINAIHIIPLYPFYSKVKPMIIPADKKIEVEIKGGDTALVVDGHSGEYFSRESKFIVEKAKPIRVIAFDEKNFYAKVRTQLFE
ncbi:NAD(+)/NADH kinase, partial [archaeon]|nr:NAD(+)/NADH kinase [archaeon]